jgi:hypothetical protein
MALTIEQLEQGVKYWRGTKWRQDFHNAFYEHLTAIHPNGVFNQAWWERVLPILRAWRATRPRGGAFLTPRAHARFEALGEAWAQAVAPHIEDDIQGLEWRQIAAFPTLVGEIKNVASPVFSSELCHFLAPRIFPVVDNAAMGNPFPTYEAYFTAGRAEWLDTDVATQNRLVDLLTKEVGHALFKGFPVKCKLIELCMIGRHVANSRLERAGAAPAAQPGR